MGEPPSLAGAWKATMAAWGASEAATTTWGAEGGSVPSWKLAEASVRAPRSPLAL